MKRQTFLIPSSQKQKVNYIEDTFFQFVYFFPLDISVVGRMWEESKKAPHIQQNVTTEHVSLMLLYQCFLLGFILVSFQNGHKRFLRDIHFPNSLHPLFPNFLFL